jgi:hypothetical protein
MKFLKLKISILLALSAVFPMRAVLVNLYQPYYKPLQPYADFTEMLQGYVVFETGLGKADAWDSQGKACSPFTIWNTEALPHQRGLQMLEGFPALSKQTQLLTKIDANNNGNRGNLDINAELHLDVAGAAAFRYFFLDQLALSMYLPFYKYQLKNICITDLTPHEDPPTPQDYNTYTYLTTPSVFVPTIQELGCLTLDCWDRTGLGDISFFFDWQRYFPQAKQFLKSVMVAARIGVVAPSGKHTDQDLVFGFPFGFDKSWAIPFGFTLETLVADYVYAGFDVQLTQIFGQSSFERIHTSHGQTDLILLGKGEVYRDPGIEQQYSVYVGLKNFPCGLNMRVIYEYHKHGNDTLSPYNDCVNSAIANEAISLLESTIHQALIRLDYDFSVLMDEPCVAPQLELFARIPFNGKRSVGNTTLGVALTLDF